MRPTTETSSSPFAILSLHEDNLTRQTTSDMLKAAAQAEALTPKIDGVNEIDRDVLTVVTSTQNMSAPFTTKV